MHLRHDKPEPILHYSINAFHICAVFCHIASKDFAAGRNNIQLVLLVGQQEPMQWSRDVHNFFHFLL